MPRRPTRWRDLLPGVLCLAGLVALMAGVLLFARVGALHGDTVPLYAATSQARGVSRGTEVWLSGVRVGVVKDVRFLPATVDTANRLLLELEVLERYLPYLRRDSRTQIRSGGTLLGAPVVYVSRGTSGAPAVSALDTLRTVPQDDPEELTSSFARATDEFPAVIANVKLLGAQLRGTSGTAGAILNLDDPGQLTVLRSRADSLGRRAAAGRGTLALALGSDVDDRARRALARLDSLRSSLDLGATAPGRLAADSALLARVGDLRYEIGVTRSLLAEPRGTAGRLTRDSALVRQLTRAQAELDSIVADVKSRPQRYWPF